MAKRPLKKDIEGVKCKLGIFEYPEINEDNLTEMADNPTLLRGSEELSYQY